MTSRVVFVTGMSGAGLTSALKALEDLGYEAVDNLPVWLLEGLVRPEAATDRPLAIGLDIRTRGFGVAPVADVLDRLAAGAGCDARLVFLDCEDNELRRRYTETRRRHPLAVDRPLADGIVHERRLMAPLRERADLVLDTTDFTLGDLKRILAGHYDLESARRMSLFVMSFAYRHGLPREADLVFDVRFLRNPHYDPDLRPLTGREPAVGDHIAADPDFAPFLEGLRGLLGRLVPRYEAEGKSYLTLAFGCTGGRHRSVFLAERLADWLRTCGRPVALHHRELAATDRGRGGQGKENGR